MSAPQVDCLRDARSVDTLSLLQQPRKWTRKHLDVARLEAIQEAPASDIIPADYIPEDGDSELEHLAAQFCEPSKEHIENATKGNYFVVDYGHPFFDILNAFPTIIKKDPAICTFSFETFPYNIMMKIMSKIKAGEHMFYRSSLKIPVSIPHLVSRGSVQRGRVIMKYHGRPTKSSSIPLAIFSIVKKPCDDSGKVAQYQVPQILLQAITAYCRNPHLGRYTGFVVTMDRTVVHFSKATMSPVYMQALYQARPLPEKMQFYQSRAYELLQPGDRREFMRLAIGLVRYLTQSEESMIANR